MEMIFNLLQSHEIKAHQNWKCKSIVLPKGFLKDCSIYDKVNIEVKDKQIVIAAINNKREGWEEAFKQMAINGDYKLVIPDFFIDEELADW